MVYPLVASEFAPVGWPDKLVIARPWSGLLEIKADSTEYRPAQLVVHRMLNARDPGVAFGYREPDVIEYCGQEVARCAPEELLFKLGDLSREIHDAAIGRADGGGHEHGGPGAEG